MLSPGHGHLSSGHRSKQLATVCEVLSKSSEISTVPSQFWSASSNAPKHPQTSSSPGHVDHPVSHDIPRPTLRSSRVPTTDSVPGPPIFIGHEGEEHGIRDRVEDGHEGDRDTEANQASRRLRRRPPEADATVFSAFSRSMVRWVFERRKRSEALVKTSDRPDSERSDSSSFLLRS